MAMATPATDIMAITLDRLPTLLAGDTKVKVAGVDGDGLLRGKIMSTEKFLSVAGSGFGMSSAIFGWDMHDELYTNDIPTELERKGFVDFLAVPDLASFRRIPWEGDIPFFLLNFVEAGKTVPQCGRSMLKTTCKTLARENCQAYAGGMHSSTRCGCVFDTDDGLSGTRVYQLPDAGGRWI
jgi:glutamine synthetase